MTHIIHCTVNCAPGDVDKELSEKQSQRWELVSAVHVPEYSVMSTHQGGSYQAGHSPAYFKLFFKKENVPYGV